MARVLQLYNVLGLPTERTMLEVPLGLAACGHDLTFAAETVSDDAPAMDRPVALVKRIGVEPAGDAGIPAQMEAVAAISPEVEGSFDLVHGHFGPRCLHASRWLRRGVPCLVSCYGYDTSRLLNDPIHEDFSWRARYRWMGERGMRFVALSDAMRADLMRVGVPGDNVEVIPLGIDLDRWAMHDLAEPPRVPHFLFVGRFVPKKGAVYAINALAKLRKGGLDARLTMVGSGLRMMNWALRAQCKALGVEREVEFVGNVPYDELPGVMRGVTALVVPSMVAPDGDAEGCPMVLMQAQAVGTPVVTTLHSGNPEALPPEARGHVVEERDEEALAAAMRAVAELTAPKRRALQHAGRAWIEQRFDLRQTVRRYDTLYREMTKAHGR